MGDNLKKRKKRTLVRLEQPETFVWYTCKNCDYYFEGNYCPSCGQSVKEVQKPVAHFMGDIFGSLFVLDYRALRSIPILLIKPGKLSDEYISGKRVRHVAPFRLYLFASLVFFFLIGWQTKNKMNEAIDEENIALTLDSLQLQIPPIRGNLTAGDSIIAFSNMRDALGKGLDMVQTARVKSLDEKNLSEEDRRRKDQKMRTWDNPDVAVSKIYQYLSWSFFILMPWFAFLLYVFFRKKRKFYVEHLVYSVNLHTFFFLILILVALLGMLVPSMLGRVGGWIFLFVLIYSILGIRNFYKTKWISSIFYTLAIFTSYLVSALILYIAAISIFVALL